MGANRVRASPLNIVIVQFHIHMNCWVSLTFNIFYLFTVEQAMLAVEVAMNFEPSPYRDALVSLAFKVVNRDK
jgi:hypothetical protein